VFGNNDMISQFNYNNKNMSNIKWNIIYNKRNTPMDPKKRTFNDIYEEYNTISSKTKKIKYNFIFKDNNIMENILIKDNANNGILRNKFEFIKKDKNIKNNNSNNILKNK